MAYLKNYLSPDISALSVGNNLRIGSIVNKDFTVSVRPEGFDVEDSTWQMIESNDRINWRLVGVIFNSEEQVEVAFSTNYAFIGVRLVTAGTDTTGKMRLIISGK